MKLTVKGSSDKRALYEWAATTEPEEVRASILAASKTTPRERLSYVVRPIANGYEVVAEQQLAADYVLARIKKFVISRHFTLDRPTTRKNSKTGEVESNLPAVDKWRFFEVSRDANWVTYKFVHPAPTSNPAPTVTEAPLTFEQLVAKLATLNPTEKKALLATLGIGK